ncbi:unnamed protein product [Fraxinus pennsylvanica]|uniref:Uncharacterized protein n=1 Tax=Fraxinus pennsylvanica TaxID=56036 RepID=A0AAD2A4S7_9LAMI|nr:unnamed protein product [Fraxinus pennsylvanica]
MQIPWKFLSRALSEEVLEDESLRLSSSHDISEQKLQRPGGLALSTDLPRSQAEESHSTIDLRTRLHFYKVRYFLTRNLKAAKREVKMARNIVRGEDYPMALCLKSQLNMLVGIISFVSSKRWHQVMGQKLEFQVCIITTSGAFFTDLGQKLEFQVCITLSISLARQCLVNALSGQVNVNGEGKEQKVGNSYSTCFQNSTAEYEDICRKENQMMKEAVSTDLACVELERGNPLKVLSAARSLLRLPGCSRIYIFLGNMYAAEALCLLNQPNQAAEHLMMHISGGNSVELPYSQVDCEKGITEKMAGSEESIGSSNESEGFVLIRPEEAVGDLELFVQTPLPTTQCWEILRRPTNS